MPAPAAPRKKGTLTSTTSTRTSRSTASTVTSAARSAGASVEADLANRLEQVSLSNAPTTRRTAAISSRLQAKASVSGRTPSASLKARSPPKAAAPPASLATLFPLVNNTLAKLSETRKAACPPYSADNSFVKAVQDASVSLDTLLARLRRLSASPDLAAQELPKCGLLSIERAAILLVSLCIDANLLEAAVQQLSFIRQSLIRIYNKELGDGGPQILPAHLEDLQSEASGSKPGSRPNSTLSAKRPASGSSSRRTLKANLRDVAKLLSFPSFPQEWNCEFSAQEVCTSILIVQNQVLTCLYGLPKSSTPRSSGKLANPSLTPRASSSRLSQASKEDAESRTAIILEALEAEAGHPLATFRGAVRVMQPAERSKTEHYIATIYSLIMKRTSELAMKETASPLMSIRIQFYALECLLENQSYFAPATIPSDSTDLDDKAVNSLAGNLYKALISFGKTSTGNGISEIELASQISQKVLSLIRRIKDTVKPEERLLHSKAYLEVTNLLVQLFDKGKLDTTPLQLPEAIRPSSSGNASDIAVSHTQDSDTEREGLRLSSALTSHVTALAEWISSDYTSVYTDYVALQDSLVRSGEFIQVDAALSANANLVKLKTSISRSLERLHHYAHRGYKNLFKQEDASSNSAAFTSDAEAILKQLLTKFCTTIEATKTTLDLQCRAIDTLLLFARLEFRLHEPASYKQAYLHMQRCVALLSNLEPSVSQDIRILGTIASGAYSIGRALYHGEKYANAVPFFRISCAATDNMIEEYKNVDSATSSTEVLDKGASRWELLASACMHCQEKEEALHAYSRCLSLLYRLCERRHIPEPSQDPAFMRVLSKYLKLSVLDLLMSPERASIVSTLAAVSTMPKGALIDGYLLEAQSQCLREYVHKPEALLAVSYYLDASIAAYEIAGAKSQLARLLLRRMYLTVEHSQGAASDAIHDLAARLARTCAGESTFWKAELLASSKLLMALYKIRHRERLASKVLAKEAKEALAIIRTSLLADNVTDPGPVNQSGKSTANGITSRVPAARMKKQPLASNTSKSSAIATGHRKPLSPRSNAAQATHRVVTPPRHSNRDTESDRSAGCSADTAITKSGQRLRVTGESFGLFDITACVLGLFEHTFLRIGYLRLMKSICEEHLGERFVLVCLDLAFEYQQLGKFRRAKAMLAKAENAASTADLSAETRSLLMLRRAEQLSQMGSHKESENEYRRALTVSERITSDEDIVNSSRERIMHRTSLLYRTAQAVRSYVIITGSKGEIQDAINASMQALRLCNRALANLSRLVPATSNRQSDVDNTCVTPDTPEASQAASSAVDKIAWSGAGAAQAAIGWRITQLLSRTLLDLAQLFRNRGTVRLATYFYRQGTDLAESLNAPRLEAKILAKHIELERDLDCDSGAQAKLEKLSEIAATEGGLSTVDVLHLSGQVSARHSDYDAAEAAFSTALGSLRKLDKAFVDTDSQFLSPMRRVPRNPEKLSPERVALANGNEAVLPCMQSEILEQCITMFSASGQSEKLQVWLDQLCTLSRCTGWRLEDNLLQAKVRLSEVFMDIRQDPVAGLLCESVLSMPSLIHPDHQSLMDLNRRFPAALSEIELELLGSAVGHQMLASPQRWRSLSGAIAHLRMLQASMGRSDAISTIAVASALQGGTAVTARREMLDVMHNKLTHGILRDDLIWPNSQSRLMNSHPFATHWQHLEERYRSATMQSIFGPGDIGSLLPDSWSVLSLHVTPDAMSLLAVFYAPNAQPLILQLPFDRVGRREGDESIFDLQAARLEMNEITSAANATSQNAKNVTSYEDRRNWWAERKALDRRLAELLVNIEKRWLGAYKCILNKDSVHVTTAPDINSTRHSKLLGFIEKTIHNSHNQKVAQLRLNSALVEMLYNLPDDADDDDLEDWLHFILDSLQFAGVRVAYDELDLDQAVVDLRSLLEDRKEDDQQETQRSVPSTNAESHLFLVLDKGLHCFPWESLPCLTNRSVSRLPSLEFLTDRLQYKEHLCKEVGPYPGLEIDSKKTFYLLNPDGDLKHTQQEFSDLSEIRSWTGITGRAPLEEEMRRHLSTQDLFLYLGHGGAEQYIRPHVLHALPSCATTLLWGCSSGYLKDQGEFEETGTPLIYMQAGAPAVVGNLWDVTDKDLDRYTRSTLEKFGLLGENDEMMSLPSAIAASRSACSLRYLNGAAPVVWGIPVRLAKRSASAPS